MKIVIQCAGRKNDEGYWQTKEGKNVMFVAHPEVNSPAFDGLYAFPDHISDQNTSWRELVWDYNRHPNHNYFNLYPAYLLYKNPAYHNLVSNFGVDNVYILSAGWGLIRSDFLTPQYDITFQTQANPHQRRRRRDRYNDFCMLPKNTTDTIVYLGGKDYIHLFCDLTNNIKCKKIILHNLNSPPQYRGSLLSGTLIE
ncbi:MAG: hypothetical protein ACOZF2_12185 [Thermodesulfobacteriota bacterium]